MAEWLCPSCGSENSPNSSACASCSRGRIKGVASPVGGPEPGWRCLSCETMNPGDGASCTACGSMRATVAPGAFPGSTEAFEPITVVDRSAVSPMTSNPAAAGTAPSSTVPGAMPYTTPLPSAPVATSRSGSLRTVGIVGAIAAVAVFVVLTIVAVSPKQTVYVPSNSSSMPDGSSSGGDAGTSTTNGASAPTTTLPVTTTTAPGPPNYLTPGSEPGTALALVSVADDQEQAIQVVQNLATALAQHDWGRARSIRPGLGSDGTLSSGYGALRTSTVVITEASSQETSGIVTLAGAYVAQETLDTGQRTSLYCQQWTIDLSQDQVVGATNLVTTTNLVPTPGWTSPSDPTLLGQVQQSCHS